MTRFRQGLLLVDKPAGPTSHDVVQAARRALRERRIGHTGTLDPAATGLLLLCVGKATRLQQYLLAWPKTYRGEIRLGFATTTYDAEGEPTSEPRPVRPFDRELLIELERRYSGELQQLPPPYSAKKAAGRKFYELARAGEEVPLEPKRVTIHSLALAPSAGDRLGFEVTCSSGTYVRSLAHDLGEALGCGGHLANLRRETIGPWSVARAVAAEVLAQRPQEIVESAFVRLSERILPFPEVTLNPTALDHFSHGQEVVVRDIDETPAPGGTVVVRERGGDLAGIGVALSVLPRARTLTVTPRMVFSEVEVEVEA
jgi:tRNA pseudouridine55 synthase